MTNLTDDLLLKFKSGEYKRVHSILSHSTRRSYGTLKLLSRYVLPTKRFFGTTGGVENKRIGFFSFRRKRLVLGCDNLECTHTVLRCQPSGKFCIIAPQ